MAILQISAPVGSWRKGIGTWGRRNFRSDEALVLFGCQQLCTWFYRFPIDVLFVNKQDTIIDVQENVRPWRMTRRVAETVACVELGVGGIQRHGLQVGQILPVESVWKGRFHRKVVSVSTPKE